MSTFPVCEDCLYVVEDFSGHECHYDPPRLAYDPAVWKRYATWHEERWRGASQHEHVRKRGYVYPDTYTVWPVVPPDGCCGRFIDATSGESFVEKMRGRGSA